MPKSNPDLRTQYEKDDPDYETASTSSHNSIIRNQPQRKAKHPYSDKTNPFFVLSISDDDLDDDMSPKNESELNSNQSNSNNSVQNIPQMADAALIKTIVETLLAAQTSSKEPHPPKIDLVKLNAKNYEDWSKKIKYALQFHKLWIDPDTKVVALNEEEKSRNKKAFLFLACHLDDQSANLINDRNEHCFITTWNDIKQFHKPRTATVLTDIYSKLQEIQHKSGDPISVHLVKLEQQFARFHEIKEKVDEKHLVALILASVRNSNDFTNVFHSAMWEEASTLTIAKVKSMLISTQQSSAAAHENAHSSKFSQQAKGKQRFTPSSKDHRRFPRNPAKGWSCTICEMDNHSNENCTKSTKQRKSNSNQHTQGPRHANQVGDFIADDPEQATTTQAFVGFSAARPTQSSQRNSIRKQSQLPQLTNQ